jgi:hypothetical protein
VSGAVTPDAAHEARPPRRRRRSRKSRAGVDAVQREAVAIKAVAFALAPFDDDSARRVLLAAAALLHADALLADLAESIAASAEPKP